MKTLQTLQNILDVFILKEIIKFVGENSMEETFFSIPDISSLIPRDATEAVRRQIGFDFPAAGPDYPHQMAIKASLMRMLEKGFIAEYPQNKSTVKRKDTYILTEGVNKQEIFSFLGGVSTLLNLVLLLDNPPATETTEQRLKRKLEEVKYLTKEIKKKYDSYQPDHKILQLDRALHPRSHFIGVTARFYAENCIEFFKQVVESDKEKDDEFLDECINVLKNYLPIESSWENKEFQLRLEKSNYVIQLLKKISENNKEVTNKLEIAEDYVTLCNRIGCINLLKHVDKEVHEIYSTVMETGKEGKTNE